MLHRQHQVRDEQAILGLDSIVVVALVVSYVMAEAFKVSAGFGSKHFEFGFQEIKMLLVAFGGSVAIYIAALIARKFFS